MMTDSPQSAMFAQPAVLDEEIATEAWPMPKPFVWSPVSQPVDEAPEWKAEKDALDAMDDGHGPYMHWLFDSGDELETKRRLWQDFMAWAGDSLGQGYSLACNDGSFVDQVTSWAFSGYMAGRMESTPAPSLRDRLRDWARRVKVYLRGIVEEE